MSFLSPLKKRVYGRDSCATANRGRTVDETRYGVISQIYEQKIMVSRWLTFFLFLPRSVPDNNVAVNRIFYRGNRPTSIDIGAAFPYCSDALPRNGCGDAGQDEV